MRAKGNQRELSFRHRKETVTQKKETDGRLARERRRTSREGRGETETVRKSGGKTGERKREKNGRATR